MKINRIIFRFRDTQGKKHSRLTLFIVIMLIFPSIFLGYSVKSDAPSSYSKITFDVFFEKPVLTDIELENKTYTQVYLEDCVSQGSIGNPSLPFYTAKVLIPQGKALKDVQVFPSRPKKISYDLKDKPVIPEQNCFPLSEAELTEKGRMSSLSPQGCRYQDHQPV